MKNWIKKFLWGFVIALGLWSVFALNYIWTSFFKVGVPITLPATQFVSGWVASGNYTSGWTLLMQIGQSGSIYAFVPLLDWSWNAFLTGGATSGVYLTIANSGVYFNLNSGTYFETNSWTYFNSNSWSYFLTHSWEYFETNSGNYFNTYSWDFFNAHSWEYFEANSWTYYTTNPLWYLTWLSLSWYLSGYTVATGDWVYSWDSTILASTRATSEYIDTYSQSLWDVYTTGYYYVSWATISRLGLLSWVMTMEDYTGGAWVPQICVSDANSWTYFNANSGTYFNTNSGTYFNANSGAYFNANSWTYFNANSGVYYTTNPLGFITGLSLTNYLLFTGGSILNTGRTYPGAGTELPTTQWVSTYLNTLAQDLGDVLTTGSYISSGTSEKWRTIVSWLTLSFQYGASRTEAGYFWYSGYYGGAYDIGGNAYITWFTESDPVWLAASWDYLQLANSWDYFNANSGDFVTLSMTGNRNTAYGWGNHSTVWYFTGGMDIVSSSSIGLTGGFAPFRFAYSGSSVVPQFYTGGSRQTAIYTGWEFVSP